MKIARTYSRIYAEEELQFYVVQNISRLKSSFKRGKSLPDYNNNNNRLTVLVVNVSTLALQNIQTFLRKQRVK